jgi:hypothetical protein
MEKDTQMPAKIFSIVKDSKQAKGTEESSYPIFIFPLYL